MQSLTYNDQKDKIHAHFGMTDYTKSGYITPDKTVKASRTFDGAGSKTSYPSKSWDFDLNKRWTAGSHTILSAVLTGRTGLMKLFGRLFPTGNHGTVP